MFAMTSDSLCHGIRDLWPNLLGAMKRDVSVYKYRKHFIEGNFEWVATFVNKRLPIQQTVDVCFFLFFCQFNKQWSFFSFSSSANSTNSGRLFLSLRSCNQNCATGLTTVDSLWSSTFLRHGGEPREFDWSAPGCSWVLVGKVQLTGSSRLEDCLAVRNDTSRKISGNLFRTVCCDWCIWVIINFGEGLEKSYHCTPTSAESTWQEKDLL